MISFFQVAEIQRLSSRLEVQNSHFASDLQQCKVSHSQTVADADRQLQLKQKTHDEQVEYICTLMCVCDST